MARFVDVDELLKNLPDDLPYKASVKRALIQAPAANVVPSERLENALKLLEKTEDEVERLRDLNNSLLEAGQEWQKRYENLAREILDEIYRVADEPGTAGDHLYGVREKVVELRKKYITEGAAADGDKQE